MRKTYNAKSTEIVLWMECTFGLLIVIQLKIVFLSCELNMVWPMRCAFQIRAKAFITQLHDWREYRLVYVPCKLQKRWKCLKCISERKWLNSPEWILASNLLARTKDSVPLPSWWQSKSMCLPEHFVCFRAQVHACPARVWLSSIFVANEIKFNRENVSYLGDSSFDYVGWKEISATKQNRYEREENGK